MPTNKICLKLGNKSLPPTEIAIFWGCRDHPAAVVTTRVWKKSSGHLTHRLHDFNPLSLFDRNSHKFLQGLMTTLRWTDSDLICFPEEKTRGPDKKYDTGSPNKMNHRMGLTSKGIQEQIQPWSLDVVWFYMGISWIHKPRLGVPPAPTWCHDTEAKMPQNV